MRKHPVSIALSNRVLEKIDKEDTKQNVQEVNLSSYSLKTLLLAPPEQIPMGRKKDVHVFV